MKEIMGLVVTAMFLGFLVTGCGRSLETTVDKCGVPVLVGPTGLLDTPVSQLNSSFVISASDSTQTFTSVSSIPACSFQTINGIVQ